MLLRRYDEGENEREGRIDSLRNEQTNWELNKFLRDIFTIRCCKMRQVIQQVEIGTYERLEIDKNCLRGMETDLDLGSINM